MTAKLYKAIAWKLPKELVLWCAMRVLAYATSGKWEGEVVSELKFVDALKRFGSQL